MAIYNKENKSILKINRNTEKKKFKLNFGKKAGNQKILFRNKFNSKKKKVFDKKFLYKKNKSARIRIKITSKTFRIFESIADRRNKIIKRLVKLNSLSYSNTISRYNSFRWLKDPKLIWGLKKYRKKIESLESQGLKRKVVKRKLKIYAIALLDKQKLKSYYIGLKEFYLKNIVSEVFSKKVDALNIFITLLESRLSSFLFRTNIFRSSAQVKIFLKLGYIKVNGVVIKNPNYFLRSGDRVFFNYLPKNKISFFNNLKKKFSLFYYPTKFMEISFPLMIFLYYKNPKVSDIVYPFSINLSRILYYYNYRGLR
jgi:ribosomal protein S4